MTAPAPADTAPADTAQTDTAPADPATGADRLAPPAPEEIARVVELALSEDLAGGVDVTTCATVPADQLGVADLRARADGVVAGLPYAAEVFRRCLAGHPAAAVEQLVADGSPVRAGQLLLTATGPTRALLTAERSALNLACHLSGIATATAAWVAALAGTGAQVRDTRKTTPGLRVAEKYAVRCGGGTNHRMALSDQALVKDNHILAAGGVAAAMAAVREAFPGVFCEVECDTLDQVREAVAHGARLVLLDNMDLATTAAAVAVARDAGCRTEASGTLSLARAAQVAATGVDYLAVGALTHSAPALDLGLDLRPVASPAPA